MNAVSNIVFGKEVALPKKANVGTVYCAEDTGNVYIFGSKGIPTKSTSGLTIAEVLEITASIGRLPAFSGVPPIDLKTVVEGRPIGVGVTYAIYKPTVLPPTFPDGTLTITTGSKTMTLFDIDGSETSVGSSLVVNKGEMYTFTQNIAGTGEIDVIRIR